MLLILINIVLYLLRHPLISSLCISPYVTTVYQFLWFKQYILQCYSQKYIPTTFQCCSTSAFSLGVDFFYNITGFKPFTEHTSLCSDTHMHLCTCWHMQKASAWTHTNHTRLHTHFDLHTHRPHTHFPNNRWDKSLWDLPPCLQTASHTVPIRLSPDTQRCKNNTAALKKAPGERRQGSQKHFCLFLMGHPHRPGRGYLSPIHREGKFQSTAMIDSLAAKNNKNIHIVEAKLPSKWITKAWKQYTLCKLMDGERRYSLIICEKYTFLLR